MSQAATTAGASEITLREPDDDDVQECARICYEAFGQIDDYHRFPPDFPTVEFAAMVIGLAMQDETYLTLSAGTAWLTGNPRAVYVNSRTAS